MDRPVSRPQPAPLQRFAVVLATVFGAGYFPVAPATFGSFLTLFLWWWLITLPPWVYLGVTAVITLAGFWLCGEAEKTLGHDAHPIVLDEVAGQLITLAFAPRTLAAAAAGFLLFRVLDILKPPPAHQAQRLPGGVGVVMDDVFAGLYGWLILRGAAALLPWHLPV
ncbi:MAG: phosphatidylglycerophosphatase A [Candidatus Eisenbacteria bacterium]|nr:phosphatidylglycerophosphatase A [Candidatus Eisenbacteria bacterium]